ncbi:MAG: gamma-glutamyltransferase [Candidatus Nealsonbacteria bacterium]|nr:gamma-glutamyltransferase [Candidatus Nealsonbacteria bacterium]
MNGFCRSATCVTLVAVSFVGAVCHAATPPDFWKASGDHGAVVAGGAEAADAAIEILQDGGNAVDAAVAALIVLSVTDSQWFCFGGEVPIIVYDAKRDAVEIVAGQGVAPRLATVEFYEKNKGGRIPGNDDPTTAAVPGTIDAYLTVLDRYGTKTFAETAQPALAILDGHTDGWQPDLARTIRRMIDAEKKSPDDRRRGLRLVGDCFYRGPIARELDTWSRANGGLLRYTDLATHVTRVEEPVSIDYRGHRIVKCGAWTQGPYLLQTLRLLEGFDVKATGHNSSEYIHLLAEAMKLALADRDAFYADPLFVDVPLDKLLSDEYTQLRRPLIDLERASLEQRPGDPRAGKALLGTKPQDYRPPGEIRDTTTCLVADRWGNVVAATPSGWGGTLAGRTGITLGSRLRSFNTWRGHVNCIEPGKRPRITLTPTIVLKDGKPVAAISVAGGDLQDQVTLQVLLGHIEFGMTPAEAVTAPRFGTDHLVGSFNQPAPKLGSLSVYESIGADAIEALKSRGHKVRIARPPLAHPVMLTLDPSTGRKQAAGDPKARRHARAY